MTEPADGTLFENESGASPPQPWVFLTNRYNLLDFLSAGYVQPASGITKYYADLLAYSPGRLPLLRAPVHASVTADVSREDETAFAVAMEVDPGHASAITAPRLDKNGNASSGPADPTTVALAPAGLLPLSSVRRIHFRSQTDVDEHSAREYENVRSDEVELVVSPDLFGGDGVEATVLRGFLEGVSAADGTSAEFLENLDRINGARAMLAAAVPARVEALRALAALLAGKAPGSDDIAPWVCGPVLEDASGGAGADQRLFGVAAEVLRREDRASAWRPLEVLGKIEAQLADIKMSKKDEGEIAKNLRPISAILRNERDFKPFDSGAGLPAAKALLLALMRPDPDRLLSWDRRETGADDGVMMGAAVLVGLLRGHKKLPLERRTAVLDRLLADRAASAAAKVVPDAIPPVPGRDTLTVQEDASADGGAELRLLWGKAVVLEKHRAAPSAAERLLAADLGDPDQLRVAVRICREMSWSDCLSTRVVVPGGSFAVDAKAKAVTITVPGFYEPNYVLDEVAFRKRLSVEGLPDDMDLALKAAPGP